MVAGAASTETFDDSLAQPYEADGAIARILIVVAPYYADVANRLLAGATATLRAANASYVCVRVAGAMEIPQALSQAVASGLAPRRGEAGFDGVIALGCVIRGETSHYDIVCTVANHWLMETATRHAIPVGNAILTVDSREQALVRADGRKESKGAAAATACLGVLAIQRQFAGHHAGRRS